MRYTSIVHQGIASTADHPFSLAGIGSGEGTL